MKCQNKELAEDLVQDTCLKAFQSFTKGGFTMDNPKAWLSRILLNTHIDYTRKKHFETTDIDDIEVADNKSISDEVESNIFLKEINTVLHDLKPEQREIIFLKDINEYSYKEISELLGISLGTVMSRLHRARQALRKLIIQKKSLDEEVSIKQ